MTWRTGAPCGLVVVALAGCPSSGPGTVDCVVDDESELRTCYPHLDKAIDAEPEDIRVVSDDLDMCVTGDGRIYVTWVDDRNGFRDVWFNRSTDGGRSFLAGGPVLLKHGAGNAAAPDLACDGATLVVAWEDTRDSATDYENIYLNFSVDGGDTWQDEDVALDRDPEGRAISLGPKIALWRDREARNVRVHVAWFDQVEGAPDIYVSSGVLTGAGIAMEKPAQVSGSAEEPGSFWSGNPRVAPRKDGGVHVVWEDKRGGNQDVFYSGGNAAGDAWGGQERLSIGEDQSTFYAFSPDLCADGDNVYVVWHDTRAGDARDIFLQYSGDGGNTWLAAKDLVRVETDALGSAESFNARVACDGSTAHVVWQDNRDGSYDIYYRPIYAGKARSEDAEIRLDAGDPAGANISEHPVVVKRGNVLLVGWEDRRAVGEEALTDLYYNFRTYDEEGNVDVDFLDDADLRLDSTIAGTKYAEQLHLDLFDAGTDSDGEGSGVEVYGAWVDNRDGSFKKGGKTISDKDVYFNVVPLETGADTWDVVLEEQPQLQGDDETP